MEITSFEAALIDHGADLLVRQFGEDSAWWCRAAAELQVLGADRIDHNTHTIAAARKMLAVYEHSAVVGP
ncbi:hypothetical protein H8A99_42625 [Bradyrhizobium sp. Arg68]|uniref:hypothetical protein n=1 Tax=Bradyrhizobium ivorense TaxID=2511166 RepID=UPI001E4945F8|nr:hypothetical protein [Bradyrhizobium ivorense]MCC8942931.1 hypothetical protein [Bradyrhizobium ivorense]